MPPKTNEASKATSIYSIQGIADSIAAINQISEYFKEWLGIGQQKLPNQPNLHLLMTRYNLEKSRFSQFTEWYCEMPFYQRFFGAVLFVAASALVGAVFNLAAVFSILAIGIHYIATAILMEHYTITAQRDERFCEDIINMEKKLAESIHVLVDVAKKVNDILIALREKNSLSADNIKLFEAKILAFNNQVTSLLGVTIQLEGAKDVLIRENEKITAQFQKACGELEKASFENTSQSVALSAITSKLGETNQTLCSKSHELTTICEQFQLNLTALAKQVPETRAAKGEPIVTNPSESEKETMELRMNTDRILAESDALLAKIKSHDESRPLHQNQPEEINTAALLARVTAQLQAIESRKFSPNFQ